MSISIFKKVLFLGVGISGITGVGVWVNTNKNVNDEKSQTLKNKIEGYNKSRILKYKTIAKQLRKHISENHQSDDTTIMDPESNWWSTKWQDLKQKAPDKLESFFKGAKNDLEKFKDGCFSKMKIKEESEQHSNIDWIDSVTDLFDDGKDFVIEDGVKDENWFFGYSCLKIEKTLFLVIKGGWFFILCK